MSVGGLAGEPGRHRNAHDSRHAGERGSSGGRVTRAARYWLQAAVVGCLAGVIFGRSPRAERPAMSWCEREVRYGDRRRGVEVCLASHALTGSERHLSWAAQGHMYLGELEQAAEVARRLLDGPRYGDGHRILSFVTLRRRDASDARTHAERAIAAHRILGDERALTSDHVLLAQAAWGVGDYAASLAAADEALVLARRLGDPRNEVAAQMARADALRRMGDTRSAAEALTGALARAKEPCDVAWTYLKRGMREMEAGQESLAARDLARAAEVNGGCGSRALASAVALNEVGLLRRKDPRGALARLEAAEAAEGESVETLLLRAYLAADRGELGEARRVLAAAARMPPADADWPWMIARARAELAELRGGPLGELLAERHYREATAMIATLRAGARARSAYLVASHRSPYEGLVALLARKARWRDALEVILELDASDMLRATAAEVTTAFHGDGPSPPSAPGAGQVAPSLPDVGEVLSAWRGRELAIVIARSPHRVGPGRERVYRLRVAGGEVTGEDVGDAGAAGRAAGALYADPGDTAAARELAPLIVPAEASGAPLHVLAIGPLGKAPLAALRDPDGAPVVARRPLVRVLALGASAPEAGGAGPPAVLADPTGDLEGAAEEGAIAAAALGPAAQVSGSRARVPATRARLLAARDAEVLHVAAHIVSRGHRRALRLADGDVEPAEMVRAGVAPRLAMLAGCGSAAATDQEGWGSIAAALLEAGTAAVLATDRSVEDAISLAVMRELYAQPDWRSEPERALARVQQALDARAAIAGDRAEQARAWAAFSVLRRPPVIPVRAARRGP